MADEFILQWLVQDSGSEQGVNGLIELHDEECVEISKFIKDFVRHKACLPGKIYAWMVLPNGDINPEKIMTLAKEKILSCLPKPENVKLRDRVVVMPVPDQGDHLQKWLDCLEPMIHRMSVRYPYARHAA